MVDVEGGIDSIDGACEAPLAPARRSNRKLTSQVFTGFIIDRGEQLDCVESFEPRVVISESSQVGSNSSTLAHSHVCHNFACLPRPVVPVAVHYIITALFISLVQCPEIGGFVTC